MNFLEKLKQATRQNHSFLCVGLDPDPARLPENVSVLDFNRAIIDATHDLVCAYKPNFAFYEALGTEGLETLKKTVAHVPESVPVIGDAKRADIGNTARAYAKAIFDYFGCAAATVNPYLGFDALEPFIEYHDRGIYVLCRTSNAGAADFQSLLCAVEGESLPLYEAVARKVQSWNAHGNLGLVVGATYPEELRQLRQDHPDLPLLIPGIGAQGGDLALTVRDGVAPPGQPAIINASRQIIFASQGRDFAEAARRAARELRDRINEHLSPGTE
ncbi:MAG: orotidine-5'-phosphate decarboxylase [Chloroflexota bacterium]